MENLTHLYIPCLTIHFKHCLGDPGWSIPVTGTVDPVSVEGFPPDCSNPCDCASDAVDINVRTTMTEMILEIMIKAVQVKMILVQVPLVKWSSRFGLGFSVETFQLLRLAGDFELGGVVILFQFLNRSCPEKR